MKARKENRSKHKARMDRRQKSSNLSRRPERKRPTMPDTNSVSITLKGLVALGWQKAVPPAQSS
jgi:hypothetical protein